MKPVTPVPSTPPNTVDGPFIIGAEEGRDGDHGNEKGELGIGAA
eukprot:COSAG05_NODE_11911_length_490_cov_1.757033_1_plen_43_part_10